MNRSDTIYANPLGTIAGFQFNNDVVNVFPDMIQRSVPGYEAIIKMIGELAQRYAQPHTVCYDLGCSLGAASFAMADSILVEPCRIISVDNSSAMLDQLDNIIAQQTAEQKAHRRPINLVYDDILSVPIEKASVVILNFTLQFVPLAERSQLIEKIFAGLVPGGVLIVSEKVSFVDAQHQALMIELHHNFKRANGYSELEIAQKRTALENVLIPETLETHRTRFKQAGFSSTDVWFQCLNFASMLAIKS